MGKAIARVNTLALRAQQREPAPRPTVPAAASMDFRGEPFGTMPQLMSSADHIDKLHAICVVCGAEASRTQRLIDGHPAAYDDRIILVGGSESFEARCRHCHVVPRNK